MPDCHFFFNSTAITMITITTGSYFFSIFHLLFQMNHPPKSWVEHLSTLALIDMPSCSYTIDQPIVRSIINLKMSYLLKSTFPTTINKGKQLGDQLMPYYENRIHTVHRIRIEGYRYELFFTRLSHFDSNRLILILARVFSSKVFGINCVFS